MYSQDIADAVCARLSEGETLRKAAKAEGVTHSTVLEWVDTKPEFADQYARARAIGYQLLADQIIEISDDGSGDVIDTEHGPKANPEFAARSRLRVDSRKWMLSKMLPKIYGEKTEVDIKARVTITATPLDEQL